jgi:thiol-disulfide isomerase/thioredoxin
MKKTLLSFFVSILMLSSMAQTTLTTAVDFTVTDSKGVSHNLFTYLNAGKFVCIDFFYKDCPACAATAPYYQGAFENFGCNQGNVVFLAISSQDNDATLNTYETTNGYTYPMINSTTGAGIHSTYGITATPTYILIAPDKSVVENDMWPLASAQALIALITPHGGTAQACVSSVIESNKVEFTTYPNPAANSLFVNAPAYQKMQFEVVDVLGQSVYKKELDATNGLFELNIAPLNSGVYFVRCISNAQIIETVKMIKN